MVSLLSSVSKVSTAVALALAAVLGVPQSAAAFPEVPERVEEAEGADQRLGDGIAEAPRLTEAGVADEDVQDEAREAGTSGDGSADGPYDENSWVEPEPVFTDSVGADHPIGNPWDLSRSTGLEVSAMVRAGETTDRLVFDMFQAQVGSSAFTAPTGTRIVEAGTMTGGSFPISADGKTAAQTGTNMTGAGAVRPFVVLQVDADAPRGVVLDDGFYQRHGSNPVTVGISISVFGTPSVTEQPTSLNVIEGQSATFVAAGAAIPEATIQWQLSTDGGATFDDVPGGATSIPLTVHDVNRDMDGWQYRVRFTNVEGSAWSDPAVLTVAFELPTASGSAPPGEEVEVRIYDPHAVRAGAWSITAPEGTHIVSARVNGAPVITISEDRLSASSVNGVWGHSSFSVWVTLKIDDDATPGVVLGGGTARLIHQASGNITARADISVTVSGLIEIVEQPDDAVVDEGEAAEFTTKATGHAVSTQWQVSTDSGASWADVDGATDSTLTIDGVAREMDGWQYRAVFTNSAGLATSDAVTLTVTVPERFITQILFHPSDQHVSEGEAFELGMRYHLSGPGQVIVQVSDDEGESWRNRSVYDASGPAAPGTTWHLRWLAVAAFEHDGLLLRVVLRVDGERELVSETASLTVDPVTPVVDVHPQSTSVIKGSRVEFTSTHSGTTFPTTVQWQRSSDGGATWADVEGETGTTLALATTTLEMDGWQLRAVHTNAAGSAVTDAALLTIRPLPPQASVTVTPAVRMVDQLT